MKKKYRVKFSRPNDEEEYHLVSAHYLRVSGTHHHICSFACILYSGKFFAGGNVCELQAIRENIIHECLFFVDKDRVIALIRENIVREMLYLEHSQKFSLTKISR